jgi:hypothetical protein
MNDETARLAQSATERIKTDQRWVRFAGRGNQDAQVAKAGADAATK